MIDSLLAWKLQNGVFPVVVYALSAIALVALAVKSPRKKWLPIQLLGALIGVGIGYLLAWLVSDVWNTFGISLTPLTRLWFGLGVGGMGFAIAGLWKSRLWRTILAATSVFLFALMGAVGVNADIAEFPTLGSALGVSSIARLDLPASSPRPTPTSTAVAWSRATSQA